MYKQKCKALYPIHINYIISPCVCLSWVAARMQRLPRLYKGHTIHLDCVTLLCIYFNWVAARLQRSPRLPPYSADTSGARCFLCLSFSPKSAAAASLQFFDLTIHSVHRIQASFVVARINASRCFCLKYFSLFLLCVYTIQDVVKSAYLHYLSTHPFFMSRFTGLSAR